MIIQYAAQNMEMRRRQLCRYWSKFVTQDFYAPNQFQRTSNKDALKIFLAPWIYYTLKWYCLGKSSTSLNIRITCQGQLKPRIKDEKSPEWTTQWPHLSENIDWGWDSGCRKDQSEAIGRTRIRAHWRRDSVPSEDQSLGILRMRFRT